MENVNVIIESCKRHKEFEVRAVIKGELSQKDSEAVALWYGMNPCPHRDGDEDVHFKSIYIEKMELGDTKNLWSANSVIKVKN